MKQRVISTPEPVSRFWYSSRNFMLKEEPSSSLPTTQTIAPRSSTFKTWGIIQTNSVGVVDDTYIGDNDQWHMPVYCLEAKNENGSWIKSGDKIGQFRIMEVMPEIEFEEVEVFGNDDRGGFGTTGVN